MNQRKKAINRPWQTYVRRTHANSKLTTSHALITGTERVPLVSWGLITGSGRCGMQGGVWLVACGLWRVACGVTLQRLFVVRHRPVPRGFLLCRFCITAETWLIDWLTDWLIDHLVDSCLLLIFYINGVYVNFYFKRRVYFGLPHAERCERYSVPRNC